MLLTGLIILIILIVLIAMYLFVKKGQEREIGEKEETEIMREEVRPPATGTQEKPSETFGEETPETPEKAQETPEASSETPQETPSEPEDIENK